MKLLVGLGNPKEEYENTRHNLGFFAVESLAELVHAPVFSPKATFVAAISNARTDSLQLMFCKPQTYMNESGRAVKKLMDYYRVPESDLWVFHDELDLPKGTIRISFDSRSAGHNGVQSIIDAIGTKEFHRVRIGIGPLPSSMPADAYVLAHMSKDEMEDYRTALDAFLPTFLSSHLT